MKKITVLLLLMSCFTIPANAQFFKKLGKKAEKAAERAVEKRVERKATEETERVLDSTLDRKSKKNKGMRMPGISRTAPAESYSFIYRAEMEITSGKDLMNIDYFLPESANFLGMLLKDKKIKDNFMTVYDVDRETMYTFMENNGAKQKMGVSFQTDSAADEAFNKADIEITATGNTKTILGYNCKEYKMTGKDMTASVWVTKDVNIRFPNTFYSVKQNRNGNQAWLKDVDGWAIEMTMIDSSRRKPITITMNCISINKSNLKINTNAYQNLGY